MKMCCIYIFILLEHEHQIMTMLYLCLLWFVAL